MKYPATLEIHNSSEDRPEPSRTVIVNSEEEYDSIKSLHDSLKYTFKLQEIKTIEITGPVLRVLQFISRHDYEITLGRIKSEYLGSELSGSQAVEILKDLGLVELVENNI